MPEPQRVYLDWNASAPPRLEALAALSEVAAVFGNPSSIHEEGRRARGVLDVAREEVAGFMGCRPDELTFTSGGTEANALAVRSLASKARGRSFLASRLEHPSVVEPLVHLELLGWTGAWLPADGSGRIVTSGIDLPHGFGVLQAANHETGAVQPLAAFAAACAEQGTPWHCDTVQGWGRMSLRVDELGCATASLSGHKLGAPKGIGALFVRRGLDVDPLLRGGPQERGRRAGTENVAGAAALAAACRVCLAEGEDAVRRMGELRDRLVAGAIELVPDLQLNGSGDSGQRLPNTVNLSVPGIPGDLLVQALDLEGIAISAGSACASGAAEPSPVIRAMGLPEWRIRNAIRVSVGSTTGQDDVEWFLAAFGRVVRRARGEQRA